ncbi:MAG: type IV pili twitching motility protein PilT [Candidatus Wildermuthbacteria bacterium RIFCSPHIGHO2_12_FULL_45_9]|uniref:Type IV pili twitching motility protein PilT n=1 Tax=Candidatus Wildermuthbacteria bacterium RIFCSPHIGHO2_02_FULL_45_25 TaxID=1802450 RepID=A0A1G2R3F1_9BACT|nr:MAG: type IV pili twitching motility protein PilT [Candidatus Wildermuthbacteria bacterium RIFCSPHIGHO2_01_FULL_45_20]OHA66611.1 MAG: type IV pili twitching motility protein PilT [Candidatus Wildermuthbacteria bacterium RIFCSPHIGHO2_02_FULL_45_25]OHA71520.1 MAG: type IV pili twitching motility protein PilT [Candidatus Wildermuthbacteria bacterium RIFCSPHIGHO2_12_FULL_45_9]
MTKASLGGSAQQMNELLEATVAEQASDLHLSAGRPPILRIAGRLIPLQTGSLLSGEDIEGLVSSLLSSEQQEKLKKEKEIDFSYQLQETARFRGNAFYQLGNVSAALRLIPRQIRTIEELNLPRIVSQFAKATQGLVLITGPSGHGKSTTLAALINEINHTRADHIISIEDPIEYVFEDDQAVIDQREISKDTQSFASALRATFRQDPDVIMVGEMRDPETISIAITAAETGHLVFATLHTNSAAQTIHRIVDSFPADQQAQIRAQLSASLIGVVSQRLVPSTKGGLVPAVEVMFTTSAVANLIRENKVHELPLVIGTSSEEGMISLNRSLEGLVRAREITLENALGYSLNPRELRSLVRM